MIKPLFISLAGYGTVATGLAQLLEENQDWIRQRIGRGIHIKHILVRDPAKPRAFPVPAGAALSADPASILNDPEVEVLVELMGGIEQPGRLISQALNQGKHVVTANKALLAETGTKFFDLAADRGLTLGFEAGVCGGIPIVQSMREGLAGNKILSLVGIMNGTANYILSEMSSNGLDFAPALKQAQDLGYAEADPTLDIEGFDTAHKLTLLIRLAWGVDYPYNSLPVRGMSNIEGMDIEFARELGYRIKLLGQAKVQEGKLEAGVFPTLVRHTMLIARVGGAFNAVRVEGNAVGPLFLHGKGAGALPTASAVLADLMGIARGSCPNNTGFAANKLQKADILPPDAAMSRHYFRLMVPDKPGVLRDVAGAMAANGISIAQAIQKSTENDTSAVPLVFMTHEANARSVRLALDSIMKSGIVRTAPLHCRVLD